MAALMFLFACDATQGPLLSRRGAGDAGGDAAAESVAGTSRVRPGMSLQYQITGALDTSADAQLFVVDLFDTTEQQVARLHEQARIVIAYVSVGSFEPWRQDAASFPRAAIGMALANYADENWLDIRNSEVRAAVAARLDRARDKGFDGVFASSLGGYLQATGFALSRADELDYAGFVASQARTRGLSVGLSGDFELGEPVADAYDWALSTDCIARANCDALDPFVLRGKPVFNLETEGEPDAVCMQAAAAGIPTTLKRTSYDAWRMPCE